jgi:hypothetical protein
LPRGPGYMPIVRYAFAGVSVRSASAAWVGRPLDLGDDLAGRPQAGELATPDCEAGLLKLGPQRGHPVGHARNAILAIGGRKQRAVDADVGHHARDDQVADVLAAERQIQRGA